MDVESKYSDSDVSHHRCGWIGLAGVVLCRVMHGATVHVTADKGQGLMPITHTATYAYCTVYSVQCTVVVLLR